VPRIDLIRQPEVTNSRRPLEGDSRAASVAFFKALVHSFDEHKIRYCALHVLGNLPYRVDFGVHPADKNRIGTCVSNLRALGYVPLQWLRIPSGAERIFFGRMLDDDVEIVAVDLVMHSRCPFISIPELVSRRRYENGLWVPQADDWLLYLVADCAFDSEYSPEEQKQVAALMVRLGDARTDRQLERLLGPGPQRKLALLFSNNSNRVAFQLRRRLLWQAVFQHPFRTLQSWLERSGAPFALRPRGLFLIYLGPDGVGKTTLLREVSATLARIFPVQAVYRWRPGIFSAATRPVCQPHSKPLRTLRGSIFYLLFAWIDFLAGYLYETRRILAQNGLVVFDRYYHDILVDPMRYRYAGPKSLLQILARVIPPRDVFFFVLDADEDTILSRKQQLPAEEISRQRAAYRNFARSARAAAIINTNRPFAECKMEALQELFLHLSREVAKRHGLAVADSAVAQTQAHVSREFAESTTTAEKRRNAEENSSIASTGINTKKSSVQHFSVPSEVSVPSEKLHAASDIN
jgi:thymidylate kinase